MHPEGGFSLKRAGIAFRVAWPGAPGAPDGGKLLLGLLVFVAGCELVLGILALIWEIL